VTERYFDEPYRFIPPVKSLFWPRIARRLVPTLLRRLYSVHRWELRGIDRLRKSLDQQAGVILATNHSRFGDGMLTSVVGFALDRYFYYPASYHLFKQSRLGGWYFNQIGGYSLHREGSDRESLRESARILADAERPLVLFPEGTWFRQNDRVGPLQEGVSLVVRQALKRGDRPLVVHPLAIKYWCLADPQPGMDRWLDEREQQLGWRPQRQLEFIPRLDQLTSALLAAREAEWFAQPPTGPLAGRIEGLALEILDQLEGRYAVRFREGKILERTRRLRGALVRRLAEGPAKVAPDERTLLRRDLDDLMFCEMLNAHSLEYLYERPSPERRAETVLRIEETLTDRELPLVPMGAVLEVGEGIPARELAQAPGEGGDPLLKLLAGNLQEQLDRLLAEGAPPAWRWTK
jgi:1-acyl-sn-glycerol-3-phosphate acyltransferase